MHLLLNLLFLLLLLFYLFLRKCHIFFSIFRNQLMFWSQATWQEKDKLIFVNITRWIDHIQFLIGREKALSWIEVNPDCVPFEVINFLKQTTRMCNLFCHSPENKRRSSWNNNKQHKRLNKRREETKLLPPSLQHLQLSLRNKTRKRRL